MHASFTSDCQLPFLVKLNISDKTTYDTIRQQCLPYQWNSRTRRCLIFPPFPPCSCCRRLCRGHSCLSAAVKICKTAPHLQRLTIGIHIHRGDLSKVGFYPLMDLAKFSASFDHVDIYVYTREGDGDLFRDDVIVALAKHQGVEELIEQGVWVLHVQEVPPTDPRFMARPTTMTGANRWYQRHEIAHGGDSAVRLQSMISAKIIF